MKDSFVLQLLVTLFIIIFIIVVLPFVLIYDRIVYPLSKDARKVIFDD